MIRLPAIPFLVFGLLLSTACSSPPDPPPIPSGDDLLSQYTEVRLTTDLEQLTDNERAMLPLLIQAADAMDRIFWKQAYGDRDSLLDSIDDEQLRRFAEINYGPWDRLNGNEPFLDGVGPKPLGANFYPVDIDKEELDQAVEAAKTAGDNERADALTSLYTVVKRASDGGLETRAYNLEYGEDLRTASDYLSRAAELADDEGLRLYLELRSQALLSNDYRASDLAWMDMKSNRLDIVIGPIENYEDRLFGYRAAAEAYVLIKDLDWSARLERYAALLPALQKALPVEEKYKAEAPGSESDLGAYEVVYYAGDCNAGSKTIAINLPNDEEVQLHKGTRRLQLKNAMRAKFDEILVPISGVLIEPDQRSHITFDAFFDNTMFHEIAHGLGIKRTLDGETTVRRSMAELAGALEEGKADILGLFMITWLDENGEIEVDLHDNYVTFLAGIFRSIRFGSSSAHGVANLIRYNYFLKEGAFTLNEETGTYAVDFDRMQDAVRSLSARLLQLQGDGDYDVAKAFVDEMGIESSELRAALDRLSEGGIAVDIVFEQGMAVLEAGD